jgi:hypothetical protein
MCKYVNKYVNDRLYGADIVREFGLSETSEPAYQITERRVCANRNPTPQPLWEPPDLMDLS